MAIYGHLWPLMAWFLVRETPKWFHMNALIQTVVLMCGMPIIGGNFLEKYQKWPFMATYGLVFGLVDPKMVPYEGPRPDGRFDVRHAHTLGKFPRKVRKMAIYGHLWSGFWSGRPQNGSI